MLPLWIVIIQPVSLETANDDKDAIEHSNDALQSNQSNNHTLDASEIRVTSWGW